MKLETPRSLAEQTADPRRIRWIGLRSTRAGIGSSAEWIFGVISLVLGLSMLAAIPIAQFLSFGYMLETSSRVANTGRIRDGLFGIRKAARIGGAIAGAWISLLPFWLVRSLADSAYWIDPGGKPAGTWRVALFIVTLVTVCHLAIALARGGLLRHFLWPWTNPFWLIRRLRRGGLYLELRDRLWEFAVSLRFWPLFRLGVVGFLCTLAWIILPATLLAGTIRYPLLAIPGVILLAVIVPLLPFLQVRYAVEGNVRAMFSPRAVRDRFRRAPWAFAFALSVMLVASLPLYILKIEMIPQEAAWLPGLVFVVFLLPARVLIGWAYARSARREQPRHWFFRIVGRIAILPVALLYVLVVVLSQYTSWAGAMSFFEQHAFLLPVPFLSR